MNKLKILFLSIIIGLVAAVIAIAFTGPGSNQPPTGDPAFWRLSGTDMYYNGGNVGIGLLNPASTLHIVSTGSLSIPQGTAPTVDTAGEIAIDTTDDQFLYYGSAARVLTYQYEKCFTVASTTFVTYDNIPLWHPHQAITVTNMSCKVTSATSVQTTLSDGTNNMDTLTCATTLTKDDGSIANNTFSADELMEVDFGTITGTPNWLNYCIVYTIDRQ